MKDVLENSLKTFRIKDKLKGHQRGMADFEYSLNSSKSINFDDKDLE